MGLYAPYEPFTREDVLATYTMIGFFMLFDISYELQRSHLDSVFADNESLRDFANSLLEMDDEALVTNLQTIMNDAELKQMGMFEEGKLKPDRANRDRSLFADLSTGFFQNSMTKTLSDLQDSVSGIAGSNGWAISGKHTKSGKPLLSNDPHLANQIPALWYISELRAGDFHVVGASFVGTHMITIGRNKNVAWGFTNSRADNADLYLEKIEGEQYFFDGEWRPLVKRMEKIRVAGGDTIDFPVYSTHHGPVFKGLADYAEVTKVATNLFPVSLENMSLAWTGHLPGDNSAELFKAVALSETTQEFVKHILSA